MTDPSPPLTPAPKFIVLGQTKDGLVLQMPSPSQGPMPPDSLGAIFDDGDAETIFAYLDGLIPRSVEDIIADWQAARGIA